MQAKSCHLKLLCTENFCINMAHNLDFDTEDECLDLLQHAEVHWAHICNSSHLGLYVIFVVQENNETLMVNWICLKDLHCVVQSGKLLDEHFNLAKGSFGKN